MVGFKARSSTDSSAEERLVSCSPPALKQATSGCILEHLMDTPARVDIAQRIDNSRLGAFQFTIFALCGLCLFMDGFDTQAIAYVAPTIVREWNIQRSA